MTNINKKSELLEYKIANKDFIISSTEMYEEILAKEARNYLKEKLKDNNLIRTIETGKRKNKKQQ